MREEMPEETTLWHAAAIKDLQETNLSAAEIGAKYGRRAKTVEKLKYNNNIVRQNPGTRRGPKRKEHGQVITKFHQTVGLKLNMLRGVEKVTPFAARLGISSHVLLMMEVGQHDFKLSELLRICELTKLNLTELMTSFESNLYQPRSVHGPS